MQVISGVTSEEELDNLHINVWETVGYFAPSPFGPRPQSGANIDPEDVTVNELEDIWRLLQVQWIYSRQLRCVRGQPTVVFIVESLERERSMIYGHIPTTRITECYLVQQSPVGSLAY